MLESFSIECHNCTWRGNGWTVLSKNDGYQCPECGSDDLWYSDLSLSVKDVTKPRTPVDLMNWVQGLEKRWK